MNSIVVSVFMYTCETWNWTLTADLEKRIKSFEMKCFRKILNITFRDHITNETVRQRIVETIGHKEDLLTQVKKRKLRWNGQWTMDMYPELVDCLPQSSKEQFLEADDLADSSDAGKITLKIGQGENLQTLSD